MWKLELKDKCMHKYIYDLLSIYKEKERKNMIVFMGLSEKREVGEEKRMIDRK
jgi:hypothetical protein